jgi:hypothetical protein
MIRRFAAALADKNRRFQPQMNTNKYKQKEFPLLLFVFFCASSLFNMGRNVPLASADRPAQLIGVSWFG